MDRACQTSVASALPMGVPGLLGGTFMFLGVESSPLAYY